MDKEYRDIGTNTDELSVQLYFDETNAIKWKIIIKNTNFVDNLNNNESISNNNNNMIIKTVDKNTNLLSKLYPNIYIINAKQKYSFSYEDVKLQIDEQKIDAYEINFGTFDYIKYNRLINDNLSKTIAWSHYLKNMKKFNTINLILDSIDISYINALINILNSALASNLDKVLIIFNDINLNIKNIIWLSKNLDNYEIINSEILLTSFNNNKDFITPIENVNQVKNITSFIIKKNMYNILLKKLSLKQISWETCLFQVIEENHFNCYQLNNNLF